MQRSWMVLAVLLTACGGGEPDTRVVGTMITNSCYWGSNDYLGVARVRVELEHAPGALTDRSLPASVQNCSLDTALFADEGRLEGGADLPGLDGEPRWVAGPEDGVLPKTRDGLWFVDKEPRSGSCQEVDEIGGGGMQVQQAGKLDGVTTPAPGSSGLVRIDGDIDHRWEGTIAVGETLPLSWTADGWDQSFVQIRQISGNQVRQTLTCNTTGFTSFSVNQKIWDQLDDIGAADLEIYVGFQNVGMASTGGENIETITRMLHVLTGDDAL